MMVVAMLRGSTRKIPGPKMAISSTFAAFYLRFAEIGIVTPITADGGRSR
jgi:hypothetical protein